MTPQQQVIDRACGSLPHVAALAEDLAATIPEGSSAPTKPDDSSHLLSAALPWGRDLNQTTTPAGAALPAAQVYASSQPCAHQVSHARTKSAARAQTASGSRCIGSPGPDDRRSSARPDCFGDCALLAGSTSTTTSSC